MNTLLITVGALEVILAVSLALIAGVVVYLSLLLHNHYWWLKNNKLTPVLKGKIEKTIAGLIIAIPIIVMGLIFTLLLWIIF